MILFFITAIRSLSLYEKDVFNTKSFLLVSDISDKSFAEEIEVLVGVFVSKKKRKKTSNREEENPADSPTCTNSKCQKKKKK